MTFYFLGTRLLASTPIPPGWDDLTRAGASLAYFCPTCGEIWGRVMTEGLEWLPIRSGCSRHPYLDPIGSSFILPWRSNAALAELPAEVLAYEFNLRYNNWMQHGNQS